MSIAACSDNLYIMNIERVINVGRSFAVLAQICQSVIVTATRISLVLLVMPILVDAGDLYLSPSGSDQNPGTKDKPFATLQRAVNAQRESGAGTVWLAEGDYSVSTSVTLDKRNSGSDKNPLIIRAVVPGKARINGAREVRGFKPIKAEVAKSLISVEARSHVLVADLKNQGFQPLRGMPDKFRASGVEEVIFGDMPMQSARWPNDGFVIFTELIDAGASPRTHWVQRDVYRPGSFKFPTDRAKHWDIKRGIYLHGFWCYAWFDEALKVASYNKESRELRFAVKHGYGIGNPGQKDNAQKRNFYALHVFEELDMPGEYYLDRQANKLYFWPPGDVTKTSVYLSLCNKPLLTATGVANLVLRDLVFENSCDCAIHMKGCLNSRIENCLVRNMALKGISCSGGGNNHILNCEVTRTGSRAIYIHCEH